MARGHPDWAPVVSTTIGTIKDINFTPSMPGTLDTTLWTPAAGKRVRVLAWNLVIVMVSAASANGFNSLDVILREGVTLQTIARRIIAHQMLAGQNLSTVDDPGLETLPGGGWPLPVNEALVLRTVGGVGSGAGSAGGRIRGAIYGLEE